MLERGKTVSARAVWLYRQKVKHSPDFGEAEPDRNNLRFPAFAFDSRNEHCNVVDNLPQLAFVAMEAVRKVQAIQPADDLGRPPIYRARNTRVPWYGASLEIVALSPSRVEVKL